MAFGTDTRAIQFELRGRDAGAEAALSRTDRAMGRLNSSFGTLQRFIGAGALLGAAQQILSATIQAERASAKLDATLRSTGHAAGITRAELDQIADTLADQTTFDDDEIRAGLGTLLRFRDVQRDVFREAAELAPDLAVHIGGGLSQAYQKLGQALQDPVRGLLRLREAGLSVVETERRVKQIMEETGDVAAAQKVILDDLRRSLGGTAAAETQGVYGATRAVAKAWDDLLKALGKSEEVKGTTETVLRGIAGELERLQRLVEGGWVDRMLAILSAAPGAAGVAAGVALRQRQAARPTEPQGPSDSERRAAESGAQRQQWEREYGAQTAALEALVEKKRKADEAEEKRLGNVRDSAIESLRRQQQGVEELSETEKVLADIEAGRYGVASQAWKDQAIAMAAAIDLAKEDKEVREQAAQAEARYYQQVLQRGEEEAEKRARDLEETRTKLENVVEALMTEEEAERESYERRLEILLEARELKLFEEAEYDRLREEAKRRHEENLTKIEDAEIRRRFGISKVHRKLDLESAQGFFGHMAVLMQSSSKKMFEIGKAAAIAETIIQTYKAAQGAFAALAPIPIIGPVLGAAAAAAAIVAGFARVQAIRSQSFTGGGAAGVGTGVFPVNPNTGLPATSQFPNQQAGADQIPREYRVVIVSERGRREELEQILTGLNELHKDGFPALFEAAPA
jgi:hypothetical protein